VRGRAGSALNRQYTPIQRVLTVFVLALLTYSATAGVLHKHGSQALNPITIASTTDATVVSQGNNSSSTNAPFRDSDCTICQFHRQLTSGLLYAPLFILAPQAKPAPLSTTVISDLSATTIPCRGRAPPPASLA